MSGVVICEVKCYVEAKNGSSFGEVSSGVINMIKCECDVNAFGNSLDGIQELELHF